jgi:hypothetical protein
MSWVAMIPAPRGRRKGRRACWKRLSAHLELLDDHRRQLRVQGVQHLGVDPSDLKLPERWSDVLVGAERLDDELGDPPWLLDGSEVARSRNDDKTR